MRLPDLNDLMQDLQLAKQMAIDDHNPNALVVATIAQAKLLGLDKPIKDVTANNDESVVFNITGVSPEPLTPEVALAISKRLEDEY
ncbi:hypothetical protein HQR03_11290 [Psychrobacter okhotskensis]|mgnify:CR=1 FL=1|jgi:hypothetical protein|uniref:hypothetical protein n=1 Tax=Psychrobacter TaxID=497 RepID=UPI0015668BB2|nr:MULTISPECIES: hypothetical protein [Psychrobacter]NRD71118.1 hypothetical protein [Psychrobacter okhotskensis]|tara:strand:- start:438 stop:695 length:258 start_codon:yes stop_codon:yes gene_type:complete